MHKYRQLIVFLLLFSLVCSSQANPATAMGKEEGYIVVFKSDIDPDIASQQLRENYSANILSIYRHALHGSFMIASEKQIRLIEKDDAVQFVEGNQLWEITDQIIPTGISRVFADENEKIYIDGTNDYIVDADVAVIDTGIDFDHPDLNLVTAIDCTLSGPFEGTCSGVRDDGNGHGTHVAGIIGALDNDYGVVGMAPGVRLWAVKVLTNYGSGTTAQIIAGIDWVAEHADAIEVANMSLGGMGESEVMDLAISNAVALGITFTLAAGNRSIDVNNYHPAGNPDAITVSALADFDGEPGGLGEPTCTTDIDDTLASFSNFGAGVDMIAPGVCIYSTYMDGGYRTSSGTSMAAPHVAGAAALLASADPLLTPADIKNILIANGNYDWIDDAPDGIREPLLDVSNADIFNPVLLTTEYPITLTALGYKVSGYQVTDISWEGATTLTVDIYRDGSFLLETDNIIGPYTDYIGIKGEGFHSYRVCNAGSTTICSTTVIIIY